MSANLVTHGIDDQSRWWLILFACLVQTAALSQLPYLQDNTVAKAGLSLIELLSLAMLVRALRGTPNLARWFSIAAGFVVIRFGYAWGIANLRYDISLVDALQEGRFSLLIVIAPVAFLMFRYSSVKTLRRMATILAIALVVADLIVTWFFIRTGVLQIAGRGATRYVLSVLPLALFVWVTMVVAIRSGLKPSNRELFILLLAIIHIALFSTSRTEALFCGAIVGQWIYVRTPQLRWSLLAVAAIVVYVILSAVQPSTDSQIAGRDYRLALIYSRDAFPFGVGLVSEAIQKSQLGTAGTFFASDYGPILLIYRYGLVGIVIGLAILAFWIRFLLRTLTIPGTFVVAAAILVYLLVVPLLDYGSMIGGLLLGAMTAIMVAAPAAKPGRAKPHVRQPVFEGAVP